MSASTAERTETRRLQVGLGDLALWVVGAAVFFALARGARGFWMDWVATVPKRPMLDVDRAVGVALLAPATLIGLRLLLDAIRPKDGGRAGVRRGLAVGGGGVPGGDGRADVGPGHATIAARSGSTAASTARNGGSSSRRSGWRSGRSACCWASSPRGRPGAAAETAMGRAVGRARRLGGGLRAGVLGRFGDPVSRHPRARRGGERDAAPGPDGGRLPRSAPRHPPTPPRPQSLALAGPSARDGRARRGRRAGRLRPRGPLARARPPGLRRTGSAPVVGRVCSTAPRRPPRRGGRGSICSSSPCRGSIRHCSRACGRSSARPGRWRSSRPSSPWPPACRPGAWPGPPRPIPRPSRAPPGRPGCGRLVVGLGKAVLAVVLVLAILAAVAQLLGSEDGLPWWSPFPVAVRGGDPRPSPSTGRPRRPSTSTRA